MGNMKSKKFCLWVMEHMKNWMTPSISNRALGTILFNWIVIFCLEISAESPIVSYYGFLGSEVI